MADPNPCRKVPAEYSPISARVTAAQNLRINRANAQAVTPAAQPCNGDETDFPYVGQFSKSLAHNADGEVMTAAYAAFLAALGEEHVCAWDRHLEDPQVNPTTEQLGTVPVTPAPGSILRFQQRNSSGMAVGPNGARLLFDNPLSPEQFTLEGADPQTVGIYDLRPPSPGATGYTPPIIAFPAPPKFSSKTELAEIVENYWMALLRDVPFKYYTAAGRNDDVSRGILTLRDGEPDRIARRLPPSPTSAAATSCTISGRTRKAATTARSRSRRCSAASPKATASARTSRSSSCVRSRSGASR